MRASEKCKTWTLASWSLKFWFVVDSVIRDCEKTSDGDSRDKEIGSLCLESTGHIDPL